MPEIKVPFNLILPKYYISPLPTPGHAGKSNSLTRVLWLAPEIFQKYLPLCFKNKKIGTDSSH
jgi:hypothetical protein